MNISAPMGTVFSDSPVIVKISVAGKFTNESRLQTITLRVFKDDAFTGKHQDIRWEYDPEQQVYYKDIHTALGALMPLSTFDPNGVSVGNWVNVGKISYGLYVGVSYLEVDEKTKIKVWKDEIALKEGMTTNNGMSAIRGRLTDYELRSSPDSTPVLTGSRTLSRKPVGEIEVIGNVAGMNPPIISTSSAGNGTPTFRFVQYDAKTHTNIYLDTTPDAYRLFCFINSLGCPELVYARTLKSMGVIVDKSTFSRERQVGYGADMMGTDVGVQNSPVAQTYSMSSGAVSRQWALWWATEFLTASRYWIWQDTMWVPCTVTADKKEVQIYNRAKAESPCINFNVKIGMSGVPQLSRF